MRYSIEDTTLTALGDAVRNKTGKLTKTEYIDVEPTIATFSAENLGSGYPNISYKFRCEGMSQLKVKILEEEFVNCSFKQYMYDPLRGTQININGLNGVGSEKIITNPRSETGINYFTLYVQVMVPTANASNNRCKVVMELTPLDAEGNIVQASVEVKNTMTPSQMIEEIESIKEYVEPIPTVIEALKIINNGVYTAPKGIDGYSPITVNVPQDGGPTSEELTITGNCNYKFAYGGWDWLIEKYSNMITTKSITDADYMFFNSKLKNIPFDLNFKTATSFHNFSNIFYGCLYFIEIPKINGVKPYTANNMFNGCRNLRELDYESVKNIDWSYIDSQTSAYGGNRAGTLQSCYSLRFFPMEFLNHGNPIATYSYSIFYNGFRECYALDEVIDLPNPHSQANWTSNAFSSIVDSCYRLKNIIFALQDNGTPYVCPKWKNQAIDLSKYVGYAQNVYKEQVIKYNSGITADKEVKDDATYQALKDDPDWYTADINYSRYNHDSAVATINSLPDCSALGGNTIKFKGAAGALTDGGAINTLTEEEIAVATAKGWTVSLV